MHPFCHQRTEITPAQLVNRSKNLERLSLSLPFNPIEYAIHAVRYLPTRGIVKGKRVLDIACGEGLGTSLMARWGASSVTGVDKSAAAIEAAQRVQTSAATSDVRFIRADAYSFLENDRTKYDVIVSIETIEHLPEPVRFLELCRSRLAQGGTLVVSCPNDYYYYGSGSTLNPFHHKSYDFEQFREMAEAVLGQGAWAFGAPLVGFGLVPTELMGMTADSYTEGLSRRRALQGELVPLAPRTSYSMQAKTALFYVGVWGPSIRLQPSAISMPTSSDYRLPDMRAVSGDVSLGHERRLALVHDERVSEAELTSLRDSLAGKYDIHAIAWNGDAQELTDQLLFTQPPFENVHFESQLALNAVAGEILVRSKCFEFVYGPGQQWAETTITVRLPSSSVGGTLSEFADGVFHFGIEGPDLWSATPSDELTSPSGNEHGNAARRTGRLNLGVVLPAASGRNQIETLIAPLVSEFSSTPELVVMDLGSKDKCFVEKLQSIDLLICLTPGSESLNVVEKALRRGLPIILLQDHPYASGLGEHQSDLVLPAMSLRAVRRAVRLILDRPDLAANIRVENRASASLMTSRRRATAWVRGFAKAQQSRHRHGGALRASIMRARAEITKATRNETLSEIKSLQAECDRLRAEQILSAAVTADLLRKFMRMADQPEAKQ